MSEAYCIRIADEIKISSNQVQAVESLLNEGATVPFIARCRKERTGSLDEVVITAIRDRLEQLAALDSRREAILRSLEERGKLTDELRSAIEHDVDQGKLKDKLDDVVVICVNEVGVEINTARQTASFLCIGSRFRPGEKYRCLS